MYIAVFIQYYWLFFDKNIQMLNYLYYKEKITIIISFILVAWLMNNKILKYMQYLAIKLKFHS